MTLSFTDFTMITGFRYIGMLIEFSIELAADEYSIKTFLGLSSPLEKCGWVYISYLIDHLFRTEDVGNCIENFSQYNFGEWEGFNRVRCFSKFEVYK